MRVSHPSTSGLGETLIYADPTMLTHGWAPNQWSLVGLDRTRWHVLDLRPADVLLRDRRRVLVDGRGPDGDDAHRAHASASNWIPMGPFQLGGRKSRRLGTVTGITHSSGDPRVALLKNGVGTGYTSVSARLLRLSRDAELVHAWLTTASAHQSLFIEPASIDVADPGMFAGSTTSGADAVSVLSLVKSWGFPRLIPPTTALWVQCSNTTSPAVWSSTGRRSTRWRLSTDETR